MDNKVFIGIVSVILVIVLIFSFAYAHNDAHYTATVTEKERITNDGGGYYLIFCKNETSGEYYEFKCSDSLWRGKFNSSTFYNMIEVGKTYDFTVVGCRAPLFSWYQNIIDFEEVKNE